MGLQAKSTGFKSAERASTGLALIFDVSGFTNFFNKPDIQDYITDYINQIIDCVETCIWGGSNFWFPNIGSQIEELDSLAVPSMKKFLGDGMLYVWEDDNSRFLSDPNNDFKIELLNRLWNLQRKISVVNRKMYNFIPVSDLPKNIKFGLAQGSVFKLIENDGSSDYIGPCINLASRLVKYCPEINFIASARLNIPKDFLSENSYIKIAAKELRSFEGEIVIIDEDDLQLVPQEDKARLFEDLNIL